MRKIFKLKNIRKFLILILVLAIISFLSILLLTQFKIKTALSNLNVEFSSVTQDDPNLIKDINYTVLGSQGRNTQAYSLISIWKYNFIVYKTSGNTDPINQVKYIGTKDRKVFNTYITEEFESFIANLKAKNLEKTNQFLVTKLDSNLSDGAIFQSGLLDNISIYKINLDENKEVTQQALQNEANDNIQIGNLHIKLGNCNDFLKVNLNYNIKEKRYFLESADSLVDKLCDKYVIPNPIEISSCLDCLYYPIDKAHAITSSMAPELINADTITPGKKVNKKIYADLLNMVQDAKKAGHTIVINSAYRSYKDQQDTFEYWIKFEMNLGSTREKAEQIANTYSAKPGHSEHQLGTAMDLTIPQCDPFAATCERRQQLENMWKWLRENSYKYGFIISYPQNKESLTGYKYEPWHYRWIGKELAAEFHEIEPETYLAEFLRNKKLY